MMNMIQSLKNMLHYAFKYKITFILVICFTFIGKLLELFQPFLIGIIIDSVTKGDFDQVLMFIIIICAVGSLSSFLTYFSTFQLTKMSIGVSTDLKTDFYDDMIMLSMKKFDTIQSGNFLARYETDINSIAEFLSSHFVSFVMNFFSTIIIIYFLLTINSLMTLIVLLFLPISLLLEYLFSMKIKKKIQEIRKVNENYLTLFNETIQGIIEIKHLQKEELFKGKMQEHQKKFKGDLTRLTAIRNFGNFSKKNIFTLLEFVIFLLGIHYIKSGELSIGVFIAFSNYAANLNNSMSATIKTLGYFNEVSVSINRIEEVRTSMIHNEEGKDYQKDANEKTIKFNNQSIYFRNVDFLYDDHIIFKKLNLELDSSKLNIIVGDSGLGKSTLFKILLKLYSIDNGSVLIGDSDINNISTREIRKNIAYVPHNPYFFNATVRENILYANPEIDDEEIISILEKVNLYEFLYSLPDGLDTVLQESGKNFSEGQKQRLNIARALAKNPSIFLFDEPTSALDVENKNDILGIIDKINKNSMVVLITHDREIVERFTQARVIELSDVVSERVQRSDENE